MNKQISAYILLLIILCHVDAAVALQRQIYFKETTFDQFAYPNGHFDEKFTETIRQRSYEQFPNAKTYMINSYITQDKPKTIIEYYTQLSGQRFFKIGDHFVFIFSQINDQPATRIEIYPVPVARIHREFWPTRIDLYVIRYPISKGMPAEMDRTVEELKEKVSRFVYDGELREDIALLDMAENGPEAEIYVIATQDDFEKIYRFFRRRFRRIAVRPARDGDLLTRDFEIDITPYVPIGQEKDVFVSVEENPVVVDRNGNSILYRGWVFIRYFLWNKKTHY